MTYSIHWVATIALATNNQYPSTNTAKWIAESTDSTNVPISSAQRPSSGERVSWPCSNKEVMVRIWKIRLSMYAYHQLSSLYPLESWRRLTTSNVLNSTLPTAAIRLFPLIARYPMTKRDTPDKTIKAVHQHLSMFLPLKIGMCLWKECDIPISPSEPCWPALGIWQSDPIPTPASDLAAITFGSSAKSDDVYLSAMSFVSWDRSSGKRRGIKVK
jgi:hypothetical protein